MWRQILCHDFVCVTGKGCLAGVPAGNRWVVMSRAQCEHRGVSVSTRISIHQSVHAAVWMNDMMYVVDLPM